MLLARASGCRSFLLLIVKYKKRINVISRKRRSGKQRERRNYLNTLLIREYESFPLFKKKIAFKMNENRNKNGRFVKEEENGKFLL